MVHLIFQFQYGAIESNYIGFFVYLSQISIPVWCDWKHLREEVDSVIYAYFNSSMVRLKEPPPFFWGVCHCRFQFQYGAIERRCSQQYRTRYQISIPVWCDWKYGIISFSKSVFRISIPVWCDWKKNGSQILMKIKVFQFQYGAIESPIPITTSIAFSNFNSSMVRLKEQMPSTSM